MSMPSIPNINPNIDIERDEAVNIIITSIAMEELALAHILNAEGEKLQYVLGTLNGKNPGEVTICDIMAVNDSIQKTLRDVIKEEMLLHFKLEDAVELADISNKCQLTISGHIIWRDSNNVDKIRPASVTVSLLRDDKVYRTANVDSMGDGKFTFSCLPVWKDSDNKYVYKVDEAEVTGYTKTIEGFNIINTIKPGQVTIDGSKTWIDNNNQSAKRPQDITVHLLQNGEPIDSQKVISPTAPVNNVKFNFSNVDRFDEEGNLFTYTVDEDVVAEYKKDIKGFDITNTFIVLQ